MIMDIDHWIGIDPGLKGAIGVIDSQGAMKCLWDMPVLTARGPRGTQVDVGSLHEIFKALKGFSRPLVRLEWPTTRPGESPEASKNFGVGLGQLEAMCQAHGLPMDKVAPNKWKGDLGLPGKKADPNAARMACEFAAHWIADAPRSVLFGSRGGPKDGRAEALLIAWHGWSRRLAAMQVLRERFGRESVESLAFVLMAGSGKRGRRPIKNLIV